MAAKMRYSVATKEEGEKQGCSEILAFVV